jgi:hypothetical protein
MFPLSKLAKDQSTKFNKNFLICDIEAHNWTDFKVIGLYDGKNFTYYKDMEDFFKELVKDGEDKQVFAHFGGIYDFMFILKHAIEKTDLDLKITSLIPRGSGILCFDITHTQKVKKGDTEVEKKIKIRFNDSSALLPFGLDKLTKSFNVKHKKQKFDFTKWDGSVDDVLIDYLKDDCRGLYEVIDKFYKWPLISKSGRATTMASQALRVFRTFMDDNISALTDEVDGFTRKAYFGGRTEIFKPYFEDDTSFLKTYDVNSLYPSVMLSNEYPTQVEDRLYTYNSKKMGVWHVEVYVPDMYIPPLGSVVKVPSQYEYYLKGGQKKFKEYESDKFVFPVGTFTGYFTTAELEYARSLGVKIKKVYKGWTFKSGGAIFSDYINELYEMRLKAKSQGDGVTDIICKLLMNSLYGRFGMNPDKENLSFVYDNSSEIYMTLKGKNKDVPVFKVPTRLNTFYNVAIPTYVTSYARIMMHKFYMKCGEKIWYTDTDSLFTTKFFKDSDKLGELKLEYQSKRACFLLPKTYATEKISGTEELIKKIAMKGFDNKLAQNFSLDDFRHALEGEVGVLKMTNPSKMARFKTALRKKDFLVMMEEQERQIKSFYDKRRVYKTNSGQYETEPLVIRDGKVINASSWT